MLLFYQMTKDISFVTLLVGKPFLEGKNQIILVSSMFFTVAGHWNGYI
jgi:hypothetical protein